MVYILDQLHNGRELKQVERCEFDVHTSLLSLKLGREIYLPSLFVLKDAFWNKIQGCKEN
jgi:hypothetical protein